MHQRCLLYYWLRNCHESQQLPSANALYAVVSFWRGFWESWPCRSGSDITAPLTNDSANGSVSQQIMFIPECKTITEPNYETPLCPRVGLKHYQKSSSIEQSGKDNQWFLWCWDFVWNIFPFVAFLDSHVIFTLHWRSKNSFSFRFFSFFRL